MIPDGLQTEQRTEPLGLDEKQPRFSWKLESERRGAAQSGYRITATLDGELVRDTGRRDSDETLLIAWAGPALRSATRYHWRIEVWDESGAAAGSAQSWFDSVEFADGTRGLHAAVKRAFTDVYVSNDGSVKGGTQTAYLLALGFDLLPPHLTGNAVAPPGRRPRRPRQSPDHRLRRRAAAVPGARRARPRRSGLRAAAPERIPVLGLLDPAPPYCKSPATGTPCG